MDNNKIIFKMVANKLMLVLCLFAYASSVTCQTITKEAPNGEESHRAPTPPW